MKTNTTPVDDFGCMPFVHAPVDPSPMDCFTRLEANDDQLALGNRTPLILIHGIHGSAANVEQSVSSINFANLIAHLNSNADFRQRFKIYRFHYRSDYQPVYEIARSLRNRIDDLVQRERTLDDKKFVIIAHSMGGLVARSYMNEHDTDFGEPFRGRRAGERISRLITLGTPHHGSVTANGVSRSFGAPEWTVLFDTADELYWVGESHCGLCGLDPAHPNRSDLRFDNFNGLWDHNSNYLSFPVQEQNLWLQRMSKRYDSLISAYYGFLGGSDEITRVGQMDAIELGIYLFNNRNNATAAQIGLGALMQRIESGDLRASVNSISNDGLVSIDSASYAQANIGKRTECPGYDHGEMKDGKQSNCSVIGAGINKPLFDLIVDDLFSTPRGSAPVVSSSLTISPNGPISPGSTVTAKFSITNRGDAPVTFLQLVAGGRLNGDNTGAGGYPDFSFDRDITLNPGQTYNYSGTQTLNRSGNYSFFVAYQKTNGTWVTNVPADTGMSNTASLVAGNTANLTVTSSLQVSGQTCVGGVLSAQFTVTNRGNAAITLSRLAAGGRLNNDNTGAGGFPDFPFATNITLNPGASYNYTGSQTLTRTGSYSFFVAYQKTDGSWVTNVPTDTGVGNTASANVTSTCGGGTANVMVSASLQVSGQTCVGGVLSAQFTITNRGNAAITLSRLAAGGRLNNDNTGAGGFPDFPFATNITLNPGASYNYTGSQTLTRTGSYSFFVAYQKTDGSWVTNVPADTGVGNTASANVTSTCGGGTANPMVSGSLTISPGGPYFTGVTLTARFTITNRGNAAITFSRLLAGGRLNGDNSCSGGCPDFAPDSNITLNAGASYTYTGTQVITRTGSYAFFVAYQRTDGNWVTNVPADAGVTNTANISVGTQTQTIAWEFNSAGNSEGWTGNNMSATSTTSGIYFLDPSGPDPFVVSPNISASASTYRNFIVQMASNGLDSTGAVYFKTQAENFYSEDKKVLFTVSNCVLCGNAGFVRYAVFMGGHPKWTGTITGLRLDPTGSGQAATNKDSIGIDYIRLSSSSLAFNSLPLEVLEQVAILNPDTFILSRAWMPVHMFGGRSSSSLVSVLGSSDQ